MKWLGWIIALFCLVGFIAVREQDAGKLREAREELESGVAEVRRQADEQIAKAQAGFEERSASLAKIRPIVADLQAQRDERKAQEEELKQSIDRLTAAIERLRETEAESADAPSDNREELAELQERISQAERIAALWRQMLRMVSQPGDTP